MGNTSARQPAGLAIGAWVMGCLRAAVE